MIPFFDCYSGTQGTNGIDWPTLTKYLTSLDPEAGVIVKVSESVDYTNPSLHPQRWGAHSAGLRNVGLYHFGRPSINSGHAEADYFIAAFGNDGGIVKGEFVCLDMEDTNVPASADLRGYVLDFAGRVTRALGVPIIVYTGDWYALPHNLEDPALNQLGRWWAAPGSKLPTTPDRILIWQNSWNGTLPGISVQVDLDWLVGGIDSLRPYQWGFQPNPLDGKLVDVPPDVSIDRHSESFTDMQSVAKHIADLAALNDPSKLPVIKADADLLVTMSWGH